jgi:hypothetical protein
MKNIIFIIIFISILFISCKGVEKEKINYPHTIIPGYTAEDYYNLLSDKNNEKLYNSICNLLYFSSDLSIKFHDASSDINSKEYILSKNIYDKIKNILKENNNKMVISASIKFLRDFAKSKEYKEILEIVKNIKNNSFIVNYEKLNILIDLSDKNTEIDKKYLKKILNNKSWIISKNSYLLINKLENDEIRNDLVKKYISNDNEYEKLLLLTAFKDNYAYDVFEKIFLKEIYGENVKIKNYIFKIIDNCKEQNTVNEWIINNFNTLNKEDFKKIISTFEYLSDNSALELYINLIKKGYEPDDSFYDRIININDNINDHQDIKDNVNILLNEIKIRNNLKDKYDLVLLKKEKKLDPKFIAEYNLNLERYLIEFENIGKKYNFSVEKINEYKEFFNELKLNEKDNSFF